MAKEKITIARAGRPTPGPAAHVTVRLSKATIDRVDGYRARLEAAHEGLELTRSDALRLAILGGLDAAERAAVALPVDASAKGGG